MSLTIELTPEAEARLNLEAARRGIAAPELARKLIETGLPNGHADHGASLPEAEAMLDTLAQEERPEMPVLARDLIDSRRFYYKDME